ncbi:unnamed protein product [Pelagomonas calceolata]|uniref:Uncharacterized protein n=1 Tax=Pelagomonas calceolata TaxID=35677 RepID=A0A8J2SY13_9STRA|nr:unnamed protein product [Pelagomonas calceolata]
MERSSSSSGATSTSGDSSSAAKVSPLTVLMNSSDSTGSGHIFRMIGPVRAAGEYVESGNADIRYAIKYQTELRRRYCCCCVIVLVVLAVILIYLAVTNPRLFKKIK